MREIRKRLFIIFCFLGSFCLPVTLYGANDVSDALSLDSLFEMAQANVQHKRALSMPHNYWKKPYVGRIAIRKRMPCFVMSVIIIPRIPTVCLSGCKKALPLFREQKRYVEYFRMKAWYIYVLNRSMQK